MIGEAKRRSQQVSGERWRKGEKGFSEAELEQAAAREWRWGEGDRGECVLGVRADGLRALANVWRKKKGRNFWEVEFKKRARLSGNLQKTANLCSL